MVAFGICGTCGHEMNRPFKKAEEDKIREIFIISLEQQTTLYDTSSHTKTAHIKIEATEVVSETLGNMDLQNFNKVLKGNKYKAVVSPTPKQQSFLFDL